MLRKLLLSGIVYLFVSAAAFAQTGTLTGTVTDAETGETLPGANIYISSIQKGDNTDANGEYEITNIPVGTYTIRSTYVGYQAITQQVEITSGTTTLNFSLESGLALDELVVTGYTEQRRKSITGSITTIKNESIRDIPVASFEQKLQGKVPGVFITTGSGQPGSSSTIRIRGSASITGNNEPLYILDGIPISQDDFSTLNSDDIATISILKDASATAQYGSRASNGVVVITTQKGTPGQTQIEYSGQFGVSVAGNPPFEMMNTKQKLRFEEIIQTGPGWASSDQNPNATLDRQELLQVNRNWADTFFRKGTTRSHNLSVSGGTEKATYFVSGGIFNQEGIGIRSDLNRYTLRTNISIDATDYLVVGFNGQGGYSESSYIESEGGVALANPFAAAYLADPYERLYTENGDINAGAGQVGANAYSRLQHNTDDRRETKFVGKAFADATFGNFELSQELSMDYQERDFSRWVDPNSYAGQQIEQGGAGLLHESTGKLSEFRTITSLKYKNTFADKHQVDIYLANEFLSEYFESFGFTGYGLNGKLGDTPASITPGSPDNNLIPDLSGGKSKNTLWSVFGIANYNFNEKYNLDLSLRRDGSSRFSAENQYAWFWSFGGSWVASDEDFLADNEVINSLIVRSSYGKTGNQLGIGDYQSLPTFATGSFAGQSTLYPTAPGNPNLQWETSYKFNIGVDFSLLNNRLSGTIDWYSDKTESLFISQQLSRTSGFSQLEINAGSMRNRGIEVSLSGDIIRTANTLLSVNANYSFNKNEILDLGQVSEFELGTSIIREGLPLGTHYVVGWAGVDPATGAPLYYDTEGNVTPNFSSSYAQANFGTWIPPVTGGFGMDFSWKNLSARAQFNYTYGNKIFNNQLYFSENHAFAQFNQRENMLTIWQEPGDITEIQSANYPRQFSSKDIEDGSYIRFRNLLVSYNIPSDWLDNKVRGIRLFVQGQNLYTWTAFTGFDPEEGNNIAQYSYPLPRIYTAGIDIEF